MSEIGPEPEDPRPSVPRWVPILIGVILVGMGVLAVFTGLRYRGGPIGRAVGKVTSAVMPPEGGPPGEPLPGASRIAHGPGGDNVPKANPLQDDGRAGVTIRGNEEGVIPSIRLSAQRAMQIKVVPPDALVYVNDSVIGTAEQFEAPDVYEFAEEGEYTIRLSAPGHEEIEYVISVDQEAKTEVAEIGARLPVTAQARTPKP